MENIVVACVNIILLQNTDQKIMTIDMKCNNYTRQKYWIHARCTSTTEISDSE